MKRDNEGDVGWGRRAYHHGVGFERSGDGAMVTGARGLPLEHARCHTHTHTHKQTHVNVRRARTGLGEREAHRGGRGRGRPNPSTALPLVSSWHTHAHVHEDATCAIAPPLRRRGPWTALAPPSPFLPLPPLPFARRLHHPAVQTDCKISSPIASPRPAPETTSHVNR